MTHVQFGIETFGDLPLDDQGTLMSHAAALRQVVDEAALADQIGIDAVALGEHHRSDFAISSPEMVLAAIASRTTRLTLGSAVTVLSSDDPVRVFQRFSTLDAVSNGRAEVILGRGSFTESFPLFGYDLADYEVLSEEKIELFSRILEERPVTWSGTTRASLTDAEVYPLTDSGQLTTWVGVGGSPQSVVRTAHYGFRLMLAIIGGAPERFAPYVDLYRRASEQYGTTAHPVGMHSHGFIAASDDEAREAYFPGYKAMRDRVGAERGWPAMTRSQYDDEIDHGSLYVGSVDTVARKMAAAIAAVDAGRFDLVYTGGGAMPASARMRAVDLYGTEVIPRVKDLLSEGARS
ncbi:LLM class flavin-dependent oxidoreductase [Demequina globuliformis]|uniref:LLM class flavin-dependent oxidoreductase n=1 Tax=Demequina globuliformis TaxID=676202 RepID=UPI000783DE5B|nr:LLM class flavin-dependent oxidoreductase [Demequina globuliformis]